MSRHDDEELYDDEYLDEEEMLDEEGEENEGVDETVAGVSAWGISIILHAAALLLMLFVVFYAAVRNDQAPIKVAEIPPPTEEEEKEKERDVVEVEVDIESEVIVENAVVEELDLEVTELETEDPVEAEMPVKGREEADAVSEMGGPGAFMAIGAGGGASGAFGYRNGGGRKNAVGRYGGSQASESAVNSALIWFMRHQSPNGQWDVDGYPVNCQEPGPKCEPGGAKTGLDGDVACTGYALLCFLGAGYDHRTPSQFQMTVKNGLDWLVRTQDGQGVIGKRNYEHPVATMALAEAYAMTNDPELRDPTQKGVDVILARQTPDPNDSAYGLGWDYTKPNVTRMDSSVSGWNVMALKSAKVGGIDIGNGLEGAEKWLEGAWRATNADLGIDVDTLDPYGESRFPYTWNATNDAVVHHNGDLTCVGLLCAVFLGRRQGDILLDTMANWCYNNQTPDAFPTDTYYMYYNTLGMFQVGGEKWQTWNGVVRDMLVDSQRTDPDCFDGSWDPEGAGGHSIAEVGRLLVTAYCCLSLEVYYRYAPVQGAGQK